MKSENLYFVDFGLEHVSLLAAKIVNQKLIKIPLILTEKINIPSQRPQNAITQAINFETLLKIIIKAEKILKTNISSIIFISKDIGIGLFFTQCELCFRKKQKVLQSHKEKLALSAIKNFNHNNYISDILDVICNNFQVDDQRYIKNPYKMPCEKLKINATILNIKNTFTKNISTYLERFKLHIQHYIAPSIAIAETLRNDLSQNDNYLFIDIGSGTTEYCILQNNCLTYVNSVNLGGLDMTRDISSEMKIYIRDAETVKQKISTEKLQTTKSNTTRFAIKQLQDIADARLMEIITHIYRTIQDNKKLCKLKFKNIYICGGVTNYAHTAEIIEEVFTTQTEVLDTTCFLNNDILHNKIKEEYNQMQYTQLFFAVVFYIKNLNMHKNARRGFLFKIPSKITCFLKDILY